MRLLGQAAESTTALEEQVHYGRFSYHPYEFGEGELGVDVRQLARDGRTHAELPRCRSRI